MTPHSSESRRIQEDKTFLWLVLAITAAFIWVVLPLYGAVLWAVVLAILFNRLFQRLCVWMKGRSSLAALATVIVIVVIVIVPLIVLITSLVAEASTVYESIQKGDINFSQYLQRILDSMPGWATELFDRLGLSNLRAVRERFSSGISEASKVVAVQAIQIGQNTFTFFLNVFVMLYLLFFLLRDGKQIYERIRNALPLRNEHQRSLFNKFTVVIRATIKGNLVVAVLQGGLGGLIFWLLGIQGALMWAALMTILSLLPAVGAAVIWLPVAIYLLASGEVWRGVILMVYGVVVISLVDNLVRPILVGKDTRMPDYLVLISTLGGISVFGVNGFVLGPVVAAMFLAVWDIFASASRNEPASRSR
ncbi:MAG TPA: AI-2E family transporter [Candidatus Kapabacteria bacterium]|nr:AI-2E family transporter [Candidatus Kapabacteria bacterium]